MNTKGPSDIIFSVDNHHHHDHHQPERTARLFPQAPTLIVIVVTVIF